MVATIAGAAFKGGVSGNDDLTNAEYIAVQGALEGEQFDVLALDQAADAPLLASFAAWVKRVRSEGKPVVAVFGGSGQRMIPLLQQHKKRQHVRLR
ncbi:hypothetical protein Q0F98_24465 [Paenibacillus amylolyticus]|nr:hypothetical protein Q0F98_24465 [Paenibacillus amylolyticus]